MRRDVDKFFSNQGWIVDGSVDSDMIFCYNKSKIKEPLQIKIGHKEIFDGDMKSYSQYKMLLRHILCDMIYRYFMHFLLTWNKVIHSVMFKVRTSYQILWTLGENDAGRNQNQRKSVELQINQLK